MQPTWSVLLDQSSASVTGNANWEEVTNLGNRVGYGRVLHRGELFHLQS